MAKVFLFWTGLPAASVSAYFSGAPHLNDSLGGAFGMYALIAILVAGFLHMNETN